MCNVSRNQGYYDRLRLSLTQYTDLSLNFIVTQNVYSIVSMEHGGKGRVRRLSFLSCCTTVTCKNSFFLLGVADQFLKVSP